MKSTLTITAVLSAVSLMFATAGAARAEERLYEAPDAATDAQSLLMDGVDPAVLTMDEDQLLQLAGVEDDFANPARDLIAERLITLGESDSTASTTENLHQALDKLVEPAADLDAVRAIAEDRELAQVIQGADTLPGIDTNSGEVTLNHPSMPGRSISISPKDAVKVGVQDGVVESKNEHTGVLSVSQVTTDMSAQVVSLLNSPDVTYADFDVDLPTGYTLATKPDGSLIIRDTLGGEEGKIEKAWAVDATGKRLETSYEILGDGTLRQHVNTTDAVYPIAADPSAQWWAVTTAKCIAEIAIAFTPFKVAKVVASLKRLINTSKVVAKAVKALGGLKNAAVAVMKYSFNLMKSKLGKWGSKLPSFPLSQSQRKQAAVVFSTIGWNIFEWLGFGSCGALIAEIGR